MTIIQAVVSGMVQGITEFFPISSSGHLVILHSLLGMNRPQLAFDIFLHFGTILSILVFFKKDILALFGNDRKTLLFIALGSAPTFIIGILFKDIAESFFNMPKVVGIMLIITGIWLLAAAFFLHIKRTAEEKGLGAMSSLVVGLAQGISVIPGISRSGATIATGIMAGLRPLGALRFSFLLSVPAVLGANILKAKDIATNLSGQDALYFIIGALAAALTGIAAIKILLKIVRANRLHWFGVYCILVGTIVMVSVH